MLKKKATARRDRIKTFRYPSLFCTGILLVISLVTEAVTEEKAYGTIIPLTLALSREGGGKRFDIKTIKAFIFAPVLKPF